MANDVTLADGRQGKLAVCRGCGEGIAFVYNEKTGKWGPWNLKPDENGKVISHFATCPKANRFRQPNWA